MDLKEDSVGPRIELDPCERGTSCADCSKPAAGRRKNIDGDPSCRRCEADRLATIQLIVEASKADEADEAGQLLLI